MIILELDEENIRDVSYGIEKVSIPENIFLYINILYNNVYIMENGTKIDEAQEFYLICPSGSGYLEFEENNGTKPPIHVDGLFVDSGRYLPNNHIILKLKLTRKDIWKIDELLNGAEDLGLRWYFTGYTYLRKSKANITNEFPVLLKIYTSRSSLKISRKDFVERILEPAGRFKREFIEISWIEPEKIFEIRTKIKDPKLYEFTNLIVDRYVEFLVPAREKLYRAKGPSEFRDVITEVRRFFSATKKIYDQEYRYVIKSMYLQTNTFGGVGAEKEAAKEAETILLMMSNIENIASGLGVHPDTKEKKPEPYIPYPQKEDAKHFLFVSILMFDYLMRKIERLSLME